MIKIRESIKKRVRVTHNPITLRELWLMILITVSSYTAVCVFCWVCMCLCVAHVRVVFPQASLNGYRMRHTLSAPECSHPECISHVVWEISLLRLSSFFQNEIMLLVKDCWCFQEGVMFGRAQHGTVCSGEDEMEVVS